MEEEIEGLLATFELLSELPIPPLQWPDLVLNGALVGTLRPPVKMSSLEPLQMLLPMTVALLPTLLLCHVYQLPLRLRLLLPPSSWLSIPMRICRESLNWLYNRSFKANSRTRAKWLLQHLNHKNGSSRLGFQTSTIVIYTWIAIGSASSARTISKPQGPKDRTKFHSQLCFCVDRSPSNGSNINDAMTEPRQ